MIGQHHTAMTVTQPNPFAFLFLESAQHLGISPSRPAIRLMYTLTCQRTDVLWTSLWFGALE